MNLLILEKEVKGVFGLYTQSLRSSFRLPLPERPIYFVVLTLFSGLPVYAKNDSTHSWLRQRSPGIGYGKPYGR